MNRLEIEPLELERVKLSVDDENDGVRVVLSGMIDMRDPSVEILPYLLRLHEEVMKNDIKYITADFSDLTFMNSSGIKSIISWIMKLNDIPEEKRYIINIIHNPEITWQESSIQVMQQLFPELIVVKKV